MDKESIPRNKIHNFIRKTINNIDELPNINFYSLIFFTLVLVDRFSFEQHRLQYLARIDLTINIFEFVLECLVEKGFLNNKVRIEICKIFNLRKAELPLLLETYMRAEDNILHFNVHKKKRSFLSRFCIR